MVANHELAASFMANGYYRASGKVAPLVTIPGPGFTYALTGLAEASQDSAALVHLEDQALAEDATERGLAGSHAVLELPPRILDARAAEKPDQGTRAAGDVVAQAVSERREREGPALLLREDARARE